MHAHPPCRQKPVHNHMFPHSCTLKMCQEKKMRFLAYTICLELVTSKLEGSLLVIHILFLSYTRQSNTGNSKAINSSNKNLPQIWDFFPCHEFYIIDSIQVVKKASTGFLLSNKKWRNDYMTSWRSASHDITYKQRTCARDGHSCNQFTSVLFYKVTFLLLF